MPPITPFLEAHLKLPGIGCNLTPEKGVGPRRLFRTPTQKLTVVKPRCHLVTRLTSRISPNKTPEKSYFKIFGSRWKDFKLTAILHLVLCWIKTFCLRDSKITADKMWIVQFFFCSHCYLSLLCLAKHSRLEIWSYESAAAIGEWILLLV